MEMLKAVSYSPGSWNELSRYDVPAMLSYVRKTSRVDQVSYIGHSMGTSLFFAMMDYHPHINTWVGLTVLLVCSPPIFSFNHRRKLRVILGISLGSKM